MKTKLKFVKGEWYKHAKFDGVVIHILKRISPHTYLVEYYSLSSGSIKPKLLGVFNIYFFEGDTDWEIHENILQEM